MKRRFLPILALSLTGLWLSGCDSQKVTGTVDETNASAARLLDTLGRPVNGANLLVYVPSDTTGMAVTMGVTRGDGSYSLPQVRDGMYRIVARSFGQVAVLDSVYTNQGQLLVRTDTLRNPGSLTGVVQMVGDDNPASVNVSVLGSDLSVASVSRDGSFRLDELGAGTWTLKFTTPLTGYSTTYATARTLAGVLVRMDTVVMGYYGIPPVLNLVGTYDSARNHIRLTWTLPSGVPGIRTVEVSRADMAGNASPEIVGTSENETFVDSSIYTSHNGAPIRWLYNLQIQTLDGSIGRVAYLVVTTTGTAGWQTFDSLTQVDSLSRADSLLKVDSLQQADSLLMVNSLSQTDSLAHVDSLIRADSLLRVDSLSRTDSIKTSSASPGPGFIQSDPTIAFMSLMSGVVGTESVRIVRMVPPGHESPQAVIPFRPEHPLWWRAEENLIV